MRRGFLFVNLVQLIALTVLCHAGFHGARVAMSLSALHQGGSPFTVGLLMALTAALPMLLGVATGRWTDRVGSRKPLVLSATFVFAALLLPALVSGLWPLFITAAVGGTGMMAGQVALQNAVGAASNPKQRAENFSHMALAMSISTFAGPLIAGLSIDHLGFRAAFALLAILPLVSFAGFMRPSLRVPPPSPHADEHSDRNVFDLLGTRDLRRVYIASCLLATGWVAWRTRARPPRSPRATGPAWLHRPRAGHSTGTVGVADRSNPLRVRGGDLRHPYRDALDRPSLP